MASGYTPVSAACLLPDAAAAGAAPRAPRDPSRAAPHATYHAVCPARAPGALPTELEALRRDQVFAGEEVSLACKGRAVVRAVFKVLAPAKVERRDGWAGTNCTSVR